MDDGRLEFLAPSNAMPYYACAGALLYGDALIVGAGRWVAARTAILSGALRILTVLEDDPEILGMVPIEVRVSGVPVDIFHGAAGPNTPRPIMQRLYESVFYDPWPVDHRETRALPSICERIVPTGRLIVIGSCYPRPSVPAMMEAEYAMRPGQPGVADTLCSYRRMRVDG